jgi:hypothetical protein
MDPLEHNTTIVAEPWLAKLVALANFAQQGVVILQPLALVPDTLFTVVVVTFESVMGALDQKLQTVLVVVLVEPVAHAAFVQAQPLHVQIQEQ